MLRFLRFRKGRREKVRPVTDSGVLGEGRTGVTCYGFWGLRRRGKRAKEKVSHVFGMLCCLGLVEG
jgi:hypothetical protein